jgi:hypothetical protein
VGRFFLIVAYLPHIETPGSNIPVVESFFERSLEAAMKRLPAVAVALAGFVCGGSAEAADMPVKVGHGQILDLYICRDEVVGTSKIIGPRPRLRQDNRACLPKRRDDRSANVATTAPPISLVAPVTGARFPRFPGSRHP